jgi:glyoxylase-like metal-dependent hydrolase (beta-lactamase superfamily II)
VPIQVVLAYEDGQTLDVPGHPRVVHTPGHTEGSCALLLEDRRVLLSGDCLVTPNPFTGRVGPQFVPAGLNMDSSRALRSLDILSPLPADTVLPGHGECGCRKPRSAPMIRSSWIGNGGRPGGMP